MPRNYAALPHDYLEEMETLSDAEFGRLCRALLKYSKDGQTPTLSGNERILFPRVRMQEDRFQANYDDLTKKRQDAGCEGGKQASKNRRRSEQEGESQSEVTEANPSKAKQTLASSSKRTYTETETNTKTDLKVKVKSVCACAGAPAQDTGASVPASAFEQFWTAYPRKVGKEAARKAFMKLQNVSIQVLLQAIEAQKRTEQWNRENGRFIPNPSTWLNQGRWQDEMPTNIGKNAVKTAEDYAGGEDFFS